MVVDYNFYIYMYELRFSAFQSNLFQVNPKYNYIRIEWFSDGFKRLLI